MGTLTQSPRMRVYTPAPTITEWSPRVVRPDGKVRSALSNHDKVSRVYDETYCVVNGKLVRRS